jgi:hypothetical protein
MFGETHPMRGPVSGEVEDSKTAAARFGASRVELIEISIVEPTLIRQ